MRIATSELEEGYVPWEWLQNYDVTFRGEAPPMFRVADSTENFLQLTDGRILKGEVVIKVIPPF